MTQTISLRIDESLLRKIDLVGRSEKRGRSDAVREALELWLNQRSLAEKVRLHKEGYERHPVSANEFVPVLVQKQPTSLGIRFTSSPAGGRG